MFPVAESSALSSAFAAISIVIAVVASVVSYSEFAAVTRGRKRRAKVDPEARGDADRLARGPGPAEAGGAGSRGDAQTRGAILDSGEAADEAIAPALIGGSEPAGLAAVERELSRNPELFDAYHRQSLSQSAVWSRFSLGFASLGFVVIAFTIWFVIATPGTVNVSAGVISLVGSTIIEAVAALFFVQSNRARTVMTEFFDRLRLDAARERALEVAAQIDDPGLRARVQATIAMSLAERDITDQAMTVLFDGPRPLRVGHESVEALAAPGKNGAENPSTSS